MKADVEFMTVSLSCHLTLPLKHDALILTTPALKIGSPSWSDLACFLVQIFIS